MTEKTRFALVGFGFGRQLAEAARKSAMIELAAIVEPVEDRAEAAKKEFGVPVYTELEPVLENEKVDGVLIVTANDTHFPLAKLAFGAGVHVFVDKPITNDPEEAEKMVEIARERGLRLAVGHNTRLAAGHQKMRELVQAGEIGEVLMVEGNFSHRGGMSLTPERWRWHRERCPGGPLMLLGVHHADTMQHILGPVDSVAAMANRVAHPAEIDDVVLSVLRFRRGCLGYLGSSYAIPSVFSLNIYGTEANLYSEFGMNLRIKRKGDGAPSPISVEPADTHLLELEGFARSIRERREPLVTGEEGLRALRVIDAAVRSAESGRVEETNQRE